MEKAAFRLDSYKFTKASLNFDIPNPAELVINFNVQGSFYPKKSLYELYFDTKIDCKETDKEVIGVSCIATYKFNDFIDFKDIPEYFFTNCLAILFPYLRAFVSTISLQANVRPVLLPTINLSGLTDGLRNKTKVID